MPKRRSFSDAGSCMDAEANHSNQPNFSVARDVDVSQSNGPSINLSGDVVISWASSGEQYGLS
ncbi:hypothetical protein CBM2586_B130572 [Cupriavidus phytorum]|uniref:Uncharacterized protein n=1 Tax=Cupriavidus taiwanensis TaxID=164546 RepID=A0A976AAK1_9BURK|nr:hypothetical protein CBM2586_B130572 [Cupriavidus taiwanensis]